MATGDLGNLNIAITGDDTQLKEQFDAAVASAATAGSEISQAFTESASSANALDQRIQALIDSGLTLNEAIQADQEAMDSLATATTQAASATAVAATNAATLSESAQSVRDEVEQQNSQIENAIAALAEITSLYDQGSASAQELYQAQTNLNEALGQTGEKAEESESKFTPFLESMLEFAGIELTLEALKEAAIEAIDAFADTQRAQIALGFLIGDTEKAAETIDNLKDLAQDLAVSFDSLVQADQKMTAFGLSTTQTQQALVAAANAAAATGNSFDQAASAIERMSIAGTAGTRQLAGLGLTTANLGDVMGITADQVAKAFKSLDEASRVDVLLAALEKWKDAAQTTAESVSGSITRMQNSWHLAMEKMGEALAPVVTAVASFLTWLAKGVQEAAIVLEGFTKEVTAVIHAFEDLASGHIKQAAQDLNDFRAAAISTNVQLAAMEIGMTGVAKAPPVDPHPVLNYAAAAASAATGITALQAALKALGVSGKADEDGLISSMGVLNIAWAKGLISTEQWHEAMVNFGKDLEKIHPQVALLGDEVDKLATVDMMALNDTVQTNGLTFDGYLQTLQGFDHVSDVLDDELIGLQEQTQAWYTDLVALPEAFTTLKIKSTEELRQLADNAWQALQAINNSNTATLQDMQNAWAAYLKAEAAADGDTTSKIKANHHSLADEIASESHSLFNSIEGDLAKDIVNWGNWSKDLHTLWTTAATDLLNIFLKTALQPLEAAFTAAAKSIGQTLSGLFGGGASAAAGGLSSAGSAAGSVAGGAGSVGSSIGSGLAGTVTAIGSGISAITGVLNLLGVGASGETNNDLWKIVSNTTDAQILMTQNFPHMWLDGLGVVADLDDIKSHIWTITDLMSSLPADIAAVATAIMSGGASGGSVAGGAAGTAGSAPSFAGVSGTNTASQINIHVHAPNGAVAAQMVMAHLQAVSPAFKARAV